MNILGINAFNHDPSAALITDGEMKSAIEEEKITRQKNIVNFPAAAVEECCKLALVDPGAIDAVVVSRRHTLEFFSHLFFMIREFPKSLNLLKADSAALSKQSKGDRYLRLKDNIRKATHKDVKIIEVGHHESHAHAVMYQSTFSKALIVVADGIGEFDTTWIGYGDEKGVYKIDSIAFPNSLGMAYAAVTDFLGFRAFNDEWKVMGMSAYGKPKYFEEMSRWIQVGNDLNIKLDFDVFKFHHYGRRRWFAQDFPLARLKRGSSDPLTQDHFDFATSFQAVFEDRILKFFRNIAVKYPGFDKVCLSGGVFLNCLFNGKLAEANIFNDIYVDCNPGDAGTTLGAAAAYYREKVGMYPKNLGHNNRLGRSFGADEIKKDLLNSGLAFKEMKSESDALPFLKNGVVGLFEGRSEFGPRALGARSILGNPANAGLKDIINLRVKYRESFRPFAPSVTEELQSQLFFQNTFSPYMSFALKARPGIKDKIPAVIHDDNSARVQTVKKEVSPFFHNLIAGFNEEYGIPAVLNTSFNIRGEPIVYTPLDAINTFRRANLDTLIIPPFIVEK